MDQKFIIRFDGLDADQHRLDMRTFGEALTGFDKLINTGLVSLAEHRIPKRGERYALQLHASEPRRGSFDIVASLAPSVAWALPLVHETFYTGAAEIMWRWTSWVLSMAGGREREADPHFLALMDLAREIHRGRFESEEANRKFMLEVFDRVIPAARNAVAPVGPSCDSMTVGYGEPVLEAPKTFVDLPMADAIRSKVKLEVKDMETMRVRVDGLVHHNRQLKIDHPQEPGKFLNASVRDPAFDQPENVYLDALGRKGWLEVQAKPSTRPDGRIERLYILDARSVDDDNP